MKKPTRKKLKKAAPSTSQPAAPKPEAAPTKASDQVDRRLASIALQKSAAGETPSAQELAALKRVERAQEEATRWRFYRSIPQGHWIQMSGRQAKTLQEQAERYALPFGGAIIDLESLAKRLHDFLADNAANLAARATTGPTGSGSITPDEAKVLDDGTDALLVAKISMRLASRQVKEADAQGRINPADFEALKKALQELRVAENDYIDLDVKRGQLVPRETMLLVVGSQASRLVQCVINLETAIGAELAVWLADPAMPALPADERTRKVREFVAKTCNEVRRQEAAGVDALLAAIAAEELGDE